MAAPVIVPITPADTWVLVAEGVTSGQVDIEKSGPNGYLRKYVDNGDAAPVGLANARRFFSGFVIENSTQIDQYVMAIKSVGEVSVSL